MYEIIYFTVSYYFNFCTKGMSYIENTSSREEFLQSRTSPRTRSNVESSLIQFDRFCISKFQRDFETVLQDLKKERDVEKVYSILNAFVIWASQDHPEIVTYRGRYKTIPYAFKALSSITIRRYLNNIKAYFEEVGGFEISDRRMSKRVKIPKSLKVDLEPIERDEVRMLCDVASTKNKTLYMTLKDSGMRIGEACAIKKRDIDTTKNLIEIHIPATITKTKRARTTFVTRETRPLLLRRLAEINDDELVFGSSEDNVRAVNTAVTAFGYYRQQIVPIMPRFGEKYEHNRIHKITLHTLRAYTSTQCAEAVDEAFGHMILGHNRYLEQYIRNQNKTVEKYKRAENHLMIYESIEVVDQDERVKKLEEQQQQSRLDMIELTNIMTQLADIKSDNARKEREIKQLQNLLGGKESP